METVKLVLDTRRLKAAIQHAQANKNKSALMLIRENVMAYLDIRAVSI